MSRHSFRSQPALQRSGGWRPSSALLGLGGLIVAGLSFGALMSALQERPASGELYGAGALTAPAVAPAPPPRAAAAPPPLLAALPPITTPVVARPAAKPRPARAAKPASAQFAKAATPAQSWEQQRRDYEHAVELYNANERAEGRRWAQANRIRTERYCRAGEQRTPAFLQGCLSYVRKEPASGAG
jgi:hypothetical protein